MRKLVLSRSQFRQDGVFGELYNEKRHLVAHTLEHAYSTFGTNEIRPKLSAGTYRCFKRFSNRFQTDVYEIANVEHDEAFLKELGIKDVPEHTAILFHVGNYNEDSDGCVLLGNSVGRTLSGGPMLTGSKQAFAAFMEAMDGEDFTLVVEDYR